jgi:hypothetical protein
LEEHPKGFNETVRPASASENYEAESVQLSVAAESSARPARTIN